MLSYKDDVIATNTKGNRILFKKNKIDWIKGWGLPRRQSQSSDDVHDAKNIIIASGPKCPRSRCREIDEDRRVVHRRAGIGQDPKDMIVIGAGVIGLNSGPCTAAWVQSHGDRIRTKSHPAWTAKCKKHSNVC
jgi:dihydrolipoamide dehydrogenase